MKPILISLIAALTFWAAPARAQVSDNQVQALVEALRQAAPQTGMVNDGLFSEWQIKPDNITRWSQSCIGETLMPAQFEANMDKAREVLGCVMGDVLKEQYAASNNNELLAVRRAAAWWMTGDPNQYESGQIAEYTQKVLDFYQQEK